MKSIEKCQYRGLRKLSSCCSFFYYYFTFILSILQEKRGENKILYTIS